MAGSISQAKNPRAPKPADNLPNSITSTHPARAPIKARKAPAIATNNVIASGTTRMRPRISWNMALPDAALQRDRDQLLRLDRELHRQLLQHVLHEPVDHEADGFFLRKAALDAVEQHVLGNLRGRRLMLEGGRRILRL